MRKFVNALAVVGALAILMLVAYGVALQKRSPHGAGSTSTTEAAPRIEPKTALLPAGCDVSQISLDGVKNRTEGDYVYIVGRLVNNCSEPTGVEIKVILYDASGGIISVDDQWPASISNIPAGGEYPFETMVRRVPGAAKVEVRLNSVKQWRAR